jgi:hypothetical protein
VRAARISARERSAGPLFTGHFVVGTPIGKVSAGIMVYPFIIGRYVK